MARKGKIKGVIISNEWKWIYDWFGYDATCPKDVETVLDSANGEDIELDINSGGGDVYAGSEIYTMLKSYKGKTVGRVVGVAASAASVIGMGCTELHMSPTAQIMIHNTASGCRGDYRAMQHNAEVLENWNKSIANAYQLKTGMSQEDLLDLMNKETWLNAKQAVDMGFADNILFDQSNQLVASIDITNEMIPVKILEKLRNSGLLQNDIIQKPQKGDDSMSLHNIMQKLTAEEQAIVQAAIRNNPTEKETTLLAEKEALQNKVTELESNLSTLQNKLEETQPATEDEIMANLDPKVKAMIEDARTKEAEAQAALQRIQDENEIKEFTALAASFDKLSIDASEYGPVFRNLAKADSEGFEKIKALLVTANNAKEMGAIFQNAGVNKGVEGSAWDRIQAKVKDMMATNPKMTQPQAMVQVMRTEPELYNAYKEELSQEGSIVED